MENIHSLNLSVINVHQININGMEFVMNVKQMKLIKTVIKLKLVIQVKKIQKEIFKYKKEIHLHVIHLVIVVVKDVLKDLLNIKENVKNVKQKNVQFVDM